MNLCCLILMSLQEAGDGSPPKEEALARACAVALAEVVGLEETDDRPACGNHVVKVKVRVIRGSGEAPSQITVVKAFGGLRPRGSLPPNNGPLRPDSLKKGERYWFLFSSRDDWRLYPQRVMNWWPEDAKPEARDALNKAVKEDRHSWSPNYEPTLGLTYGHKADPEKGSWRIRVKKGEDVLWEKTLEGRRSDRHASWSLFAAGHLAASKELGAAAPAWLLRAETGLKLADGNDYGLPAGDYFVAQSFEAATGKVALVEVSDLTLPLVERLFQAFDPATGKLLVERRRDPAGKQ